MIRNADKEGEHRIYYLLSGLSAMVKLRFLIGRQSDMLLDSKTDIPHIRPKN